MVKRIRAVRAGVVSGSPIDPRPLESGDGSLDKACQDLGDCQNHPQCFSIWPENCRSG